MKYTDSEIEKYRALCNFLPNERAYFDLKLKNKSNVYIALALSVSESQVSNIAKKVESKIDRVQHFS